MCRNKAPGRGGVASVPFKRESLSSASEVAFAAAPPSDGSPEVGEASTPPPMNGVPEAAEAATPALVGSWESSIMNRI